MLFVDYQRAFDSLGRAWIWDELKARGLPSKLLNIIKEGYEEFSCRVLHEGQLSDLIRWRNTKGRPTLESSRKQEERKSEK